MEKEKILIIDDDDDILRVVQYNLEKIGYNVIISENGDDGFEKIKSANPDLVLIDFIIPDFGARISFSIFIASWIKIISFSFTWLFTEKNIFLIYHL